MTSHKYTDEERDFIAKHAPGIGNKELTDLFNEQFSENLTVAQMKSYKNNKKISSGLTGYYPKGHVPINKGTKGMFNVGGNSTSFKKGQQPINTDPIGTEKTLSDGYTYIKVNNQTKVKKQDNWQKKHCAVWEEQNGPIPEGNVVIFLDGDRGNFDINNLALVTRAQLLIMNQRGLIKKNQPYITQVGATIAKVITKTIEKSEEATSLQWEEVYYLTDGELKCKRGYSCSYKDFKYGIVCTRDGRQRVAIVYDWLTGLEVLRASKRLDAHKQIADAKIQKRLEVIRRGKNYQRKIEEFEQIKKEQDNAK